MVSCSPERTDEVLRIADRYGVPAARIGSVTAAADGFRISVPGASIAATPGDMAEAYFGALPSLMDTPSTSGV